MCYTTLHRHVSGAVQRQDGLTSFKTHCCRRTGGTKTGIFLLMAPMSCAKTQTAVKDKIAANQMPFEPAEAQRNPK